ARRRKSAGHQDGPALVAGGARQRAAGRLQPGGTGPPPAPRGRSVPRGSRTPVDVSGTALPPLTTERLVIRPLRTDDQEAVERLYADIARTDAGRALIDHAFGYLKLDRIVATTTHTNAASIGLMEKLGMQIDRNPYPDPPWLQVVGVLLHPSLRGMRVEA